MSRVSAVSADQRDVQEAVARLLARNAQPSVDAFDEQVWTALEEAGFTDPDADLPLAAAVVQACAPVAVMAPVAESVLVGRWLAAQLDADVSRTGPVVTAWCDARAMGWVDPHAVLTARAVPWARGVPWGRTSVTVLVVADYGEDVGITLPGAGVIVSDVGPNLAGEPRADVVMHTRAAATVAGLGEDLVAELRRRHALARAVALDAVIAETVGLTLRYAVQRRQFGRSIASFQLVRHRLAELIGERDSVSALVAAAISERDSDPCTSALAARVRAADAASSVARSAHQLHGAIGTTQEFRLSRLTRRLWAWRDEYGTQGEWETALGRRLLAAPDGLWALLTSVPRDVG
jgi:acyl-CoA dehydrogenase